MRRGRLILFLVVVTTSVLAELARGGTQTRATILSMVAWATFATFFLAWAWEECGVRAGVRALARLVVLSAVAFLVLYLYYRHSGLVDAGIEVDSTYTFIGLAWFAQLRNPITFSGHTISYSQFPMSLLGHLPGYLVGFDRLGPFAIHVANMLQIATLFALLTTFVVDRPLLTQAAVVAGVAAVFANRYTVLLYNLIGYTIPAVAIGVMFLIIVMQERGPSVFRRVGALTTLAVTQHYTGAFFVLPIVGVWLLAARTPWRRVGGFIVANAPLLVVLSMAGICVAIHPELLMARVKDVTSPTLALDEFRQKIAQNWAYLHGRFPAEFMRVFFRETPGSWHLLSIPPLGGLVAPIVLGNWVATRVALGERGLRYTVGLVVLGTCLVLLTGLQHVLTGFENYRDMTLLTALVTSGVGFVLLVPRVGPVLRVVLIAYGLAVAAYGYVDVGQLAGRHYTVAEYAPEQQAAMEKVRRFWRHEGGDRLRDAVVHMVVAEPFPLEMLYVDAARQHGITLRFVNAGVFCADPLSLVRGILQSKCARVAFGLPASTCEKAWTQLGWPAPGTTGTALYLFESTCGKPAPQRWATPNVVDLG